MLIRTSNFSIKPLKSENMSTRSLTVNMFKISVKEFNHFLSKSDDNNDHEAMVQFNKLAFIGKRIMQVLLRNPVTPLGLQSSYAHLSHVNISWQVNAQEHYHIHIDCANNALKKETIETLLESNKKKNSMQHELLPSRKGKRVGFSLRTDVRLIPGLKHDDTSGSFTPKKLKMKANNAQYDVELQLAIQLSLGTSSLESTGNSGLPGTPGQPGTSGSSTAWYPEASAPSGFPGIAETGLMDTADMGESWKHTLRALREDEERGQVLVECPVCSIKKKSKRINQHLEDYHGFN